MKDVYRYLMKINPEYEFSDVPIVGLCCDELRRFADADGVFTKSFDVTLSRDLEIADIWVLSTDAFYVCDGDTPPAIQIRIISGDKETLYYSPVYEIGHTREFYRREWRIPPTRDRFDTVRISFIIPDGARLYIRDIRAKRNTRHREGEIGIRYHGHAGFPGYAPSNSVFGFQMAAELGFTSCITIPKFTKDGIGVCFHDDDSVIKILRYADGSAIEKGSPEDKPVRDYTYEELITLDAGAARSDIYANTRVPTMDDFFRICSMTGMSPIFSVHPSLSIDEWKYVRELLEKYRLLEKFWIKSNVPEDHKAVLSVFGDRIAGHIIIYPVAADTDPLEYAQMCGLDPKKHRIVMEYFYIPYNEETVDERIRRARDEGFNVSVAAMRGGVSGVTMRKLIDIGVSEFTIDYHCSMGLDW